MKQVTFGLLVAVLWTINLPGIFHRADAQTPQYDPTKFTITFYKIENIPCQEFDNETGDCISETKKYTYEGVIPHDDSIELTLGGTPYEVTPDSEDYVFLTGIATELYYVNEAGGREFIERNDDFEYEFWKEGTYELELYDGQQYELGSISKQGMSLSNSFFPVAHAEFGPPAYYTTIRFEVVEESVAEGNPSVLFLPGVQASRLYDASDDNRLWEPSGNSDVEKLALDASGNSIEEVYTSDIIDEVDALPIFQSNIYKGFLSHLDDLVEEGVIAGWEAYAYDWRQDVFDIVNNGTAYPNGEQKYLVEMIEELAQDSQNGKVAIIGHSNGGLLAKALVMKLEEEGKDDLVDSIIFVATPHLGTPKTIATVLHGYDQEKLGGLIVDDEVARDVIRNMPSVYGLLPTAEYISQAGTPIVFFDTSVSTESFVNAYGFGVNTITEFIDFMNGAEGRSSGDVPLNEPITANDSLFTEARDMHEVLDTWEAPEHVQVYEIIGTGLATVKALEYREMTERTCITGTNPPICTQETLLKPYLHRTRYGDETVMSLSASGYVGAKEKFYINLPREGAQLFTKSRDHADLMESETTMSVISNLLMKVEVEETSTVSNTQPLFTDRQNVVSVHSPVQIFVEDNEGNITGIDANGNFKEDIPGSSYTEFAESKYIVFPEGIDIKATMLGEAEGGYTLIIDELDGEITENLHTASNMPVAPDMVASFSKTNGTFSTIAVDYNGDGESDSEFTVDGEDVTPSEPTPQELLQQFRASLDGMAISSSIKKNLKASSLLAEELINADKIKLAKLTIASMEVAIKWRESRREISSANAETLLDLLRRAREGL